nr:10588_t:CDS:2 [Entrophospora candida]
MSSSGKDIIEAIDEVIRMIDSPESLFSTVSSNETLVDFPKSIDSSFGNKEQSSSSSKVPKITLEYIDEEKISDFLPGSSSSVLKNSNKIIDDSRPFSTSVNTSFDPDDIPPIYTDRKKSIYKPVQKPPMTITKTSILHIFRFATRLDHLIMTFGIFFSIINGLVIPFMTYLLGGLFNVFTEIEQGSISEDEFKQRVNILVLDFVELGIGAFGITAINTFLWMWTAERQARRMKLEYFNSLLEMPISYFEREEVTSGGLLAGVNKDTEDVHIVIATNLGLIICYIVTFIACLALAFSKHVVLTFVILASMPLVFLVLALTSRAASPLIKQERDIFVLAGEIIESSLSNIKTIRSFNGEEKQEKKHEVCIKEANKVSSNLAWIYALRTGLIQFLLLSLFVQGFWYGSILVADGNLTPGDVLSVFYATLLGANMLKSVLPLLVSITKAKNGIRSINNLLEKVALKRLEALRGFSLPSIKGDIEFYQVSFSYPSRPESVVLKNIDIVIPSGKTTVLVGQSGSGKSTIAQLIQKLYEPDEGTIMLDGRELKIVNVDWLRSKIGVVSQEPVLFDETIFKNVAYGRSDYEDVTMDEVINACKLACIHDEIMELAEGYDTVVGDKAGKLSGGQRQRIAIARALIKDPAILILDEASSALDMTSDMLVQQALENSSNGRTTIVITHQLKHIREDDLVYVLHDGEVVEKGLVADLLEIKDSYYSKLLKESYKNPHPKRRTHEFPTKLTTPGNNLLHRSLSVGVQVGWRKSVYEDYFESSAMDVLQGTATAAITKRYENRVSYFDLLSYYDYVDDGGIIDVIVTNAIGDAPKDNVKMKFFQLMKLTMNNKTLYAFGLIACIINGLVMPVFSFVLAKLLATYSISDSEQLIANSRNLALTVLAIAAINGGSAHFKYFLLERASEDWAVRLRHLGFGTILRQSQSWFDKPENVTGKLTTILTTDTEATKNLIGHFAGSIVYGTVTLVGGMIWSIIVGWQLTLVGFGFVPILLLGSEIQVYVLQKYERMQKSSYENASNVFYQTISSVRTVFCLAVEKAMLLKFHDSLRRPYIIGIRKAVISALTAGFIEGLSYLTKAVTFWYGAQLVANGTYNLSTMLTVWTLVVFCTSSATQMLATIPYYAKSKQAAKSISKIINLPTLPTTTGKILESLQGTIVFKDVYFSYPERPNSRVLSGLDLTLQQGQSVALVGKSGNGKSTVAALLQRLYEPDSGQILLDYTNIKELQMYWLRDIIGVVSQEPVLFEATVAENIAYGKEDATAEEIEQVARQVNMHEYILGLPKGYLTKIGSSGSQLSGGQKQRIAIARTLLKNPKILILDEATSALDATNEAIVQETLSQVQKGRTTLVITHRLTAVKSLDRIAYIEDGRIVETGTHKELMSLKGRYFDLVRSDNI